MTVKDIATVTVYPYSEQLELLFTHLMIKATLARLGCVGGLRINLGGVLLTDNKADKRFGVVATSIPHQHLHYSLSTQYETTHLVHSSRID